MNMYIDFLELLPEFIDEVVYEIIKDLINCSVFGSNDFIHLSNLSCNLFIQIIGLFRWK